MMFKTPLSPENSEDPNSAQNQREFYPAKALIRIAIFAGAAGVVVIGYGAFSTDQAKHIGVGLMTAAGSAVIGALLGFVFGVPFSRAGSASNQGDSDDKSKDSVTPPSAPPYKPNTTLEQISEWLSKMLVGVGLVELKSLSKQLDTLAGFIAKGLGNDDIGKVFAYFVLLLFAGCGFLFGFIWARIYLPSWFTRADLNMIMQEVDRKVHRVKADSEDIVRKLGNKVSQIEADARALTLATQQLLQPTEEGSLVSLEELTDAVKKASRTTKAEIFDRARQASETGRGTPEHEPRNESAINIFRALIADDPKGYYHRTRAELSYALNRRRHRDIDESIEALSEAIRLRDDHAVNGWRSYELRRARYRIENDKEFKSGKTTSQPLKDLILEDLNAASKDDKWKGWIENENNKAVKDWLEKNDPSLLQP